MAVFLVQQNAISLYDEYQLMWVKLQLKARWINVGSKCAAMT